MRLAGRHETATRRAARPPAAAALLALALVVPALSCGGSHVATVDPVTPPGVCLDFSPAADPAAGTVVASEGNLTSCDRLVLDLIVTDVSDLFTADFSLSFDPAVLSYTGYSDTGSVLASDGATVTVFDDEQNGLLEVTITRMGAALGGIDVVGSQLLVRVNFDREVDAGGSSLDFSNERLWNSEWPLELIPGVVWSGGSVTIR